MSVTGDPQGPGWCDILVPIGIALAALYGIVEAIGHIAHWIALGIRHL